MWRRMVLPGQLARCDCFWPRDPEWFSEQNGYLVPDSSDLLRVAFTGGERPNEEGWLFCIILSKDGTSEGPVRTSPRPQCGWIPAWAVTRLKPPGPLWRLAWDGLPYTSTEWMDYYGHEAGQEFWAHAPVCAPVANTSF